VTIQEAHEALGFADQGADWPLIKARFRALVRQRHPDAAAESATRSDNDYDIVTLIDAYRLLEQVHRLLHEHGAFSTEATTSRGHYVSDQLVPMKAFAPSVDAAQSLLVSGTKATISTRARKYKWAIAALFGLLLISIAKA
jgi:hypothetical protein